MLQQLKLPAAEYTNGSFLTIHRPWEVFLKSNTKPNNLLSLHIGKGISPF